MNDLDLIMTNLSRIGKYYKVTASEGSPKIVEEAALVHVQLNRAEDAVALDLAVGLALHATGPQCNVTIHRHGMNTRVTGGTVRALSKRRDEQLALYFNGGAITLAEKGTIIEARSAPNNPKADSVDIIRGTVSAKGDSLASVPRSYKAGASFRWSELVPGPVSSSAVAP